MYKWYALLSDAILRVDEDVAFCSFAAFDIPQSIHNSDVAPSFEVASAAEYLMHHASRMDMGIALGSKHIETVELLALYSGIIWITDSKVLNKDTRLVAYTDNTSVAEAYARHNEVWKGKRYETYRPTPRNTCILSFSDICLSTEFRMFAKSLYNLKTTCKFNAYTNMQVLHVSGRKVKESVLGH